MEPSKPDPDHIDAIALPQSENDYRDPVDEFVLLSLESDFDDAKQYVEAHAGAISQDDLLKLYGLFKQSVVGTCDKPKPGLLQFSQRAKWDAWSKLGNMSKEDAIAAYISELGRIAPTWKDEKTETEKKANQSITAQAVSRPVFEEEKAPSVSEMNIIYHATINNADKVRELVAKGVDVNHQDEEGRSALHWATDRGHIELAKVLVTELHANINLQDNEQQTPLHYACNCEHLELIKLLLTHGADPNIKDESGDSPLDLAAQSPEILELMKSSK